MKGTPADHSNTSIYADPLILTSVTVCSHFKTLYIKSHKDKALLQVAVST